LPEPAPNQGNHEVRSKSWQDCLATVCINFDAICRVIPTLASHFYHSVSSLIV
jgi:hypothetical protein